jgi:hypothetical protein
VPRRNEDLKQQTGTEKSELGVCKENRKWWKTRMVPEIAHSEKRDRWRKREKMQKQVVKTSYSIKNT